jgi:hypothetical protein
MELGDLAWDYTDAYESSDGMSTSLNRRMVIILSYPTHPTTCKSARVLTLDGIVKNVPIELLMPFAAK